MFRKHTESISIDELLQSLDTLNGPQDIKKVLKNFIDNQLLKATGIIIIWTHGNQVDIDGTRFSETESVWALEKAKHEIMNKGISFHE